MGKQAKPKPVEKLRRNPDRRNGKATKVGKASNGFTGKTLGGYSLATLERRAAKRPGDKAASDMVVKMLRKALPTDN